MKQALIRQGCTESKRTAIISGLTIQMDKENVVFTYNGILLSIRKGDPAICDYMGEPGGHYAKRSKPITKDKYCTSPLSMRYVE